VKEKILTVYKIYMELYIGIPNNFQINESLTLTLSKIDDDFYYDQGL